MRFREALIIVPDHPAARAMVEQRLLAAFGGYTAVMGNGGWIGPDGPVHEPVTVYTVAVPEYCGIGSLADYPWAGAYGELRSLAAAVARAADQACVYIRVPSPDGDMVFMIRPNGLNYNPDAAVFPYRRRKAQ